MWLAVWLVIPVAVDPPVVGRPRDFSGAIGGPFVVEMTTATSAVTVEEPLELTLRISGPGNLHDLRRPDFRKLGRFNSDFAVEDGADRFDAATQSRKFVYRLRPRRMDVAEVPRYKFVYFNPAMQPPSRGFMTTYAEPIPITINPRTEAVVASIPVPQWMFDEWTAEHGAKMPSAEPSLILAWRDGLLAKVGIAVDRPGRGGISPFLFISAIAVPPLACSLWYWIWRRANPDAARRAIAGRRRAVLSALRVLKHGDDPARSANAALLAYVHERFDRPVDVTTPAEVEALLQAHGQSADRVRLVGELLRRCDQARFATGSAGGTELNAAAERLILDCEGVP